MNLASFRFAEKKRLVLKVLGVHKVCFKSPERHKTITEGIQLSEPRNHICREPERPRHLIWPILFSNLIAIGFKIQPNPPDRGTVYSLHQDSATAPRRAGNRTAMPVRLLPLPLSYLPPRSLRASSREQQQPRLHATRGRTWRPSPSSRTPPCSANRCRPLPSLFLLMRAPGSGCPGCIVSCFLESRPFLCRYMDLA